MHWFKLILIALIVMDAFYRIYMVSKRRDPVHSLYAAVGAIVAGVLIGGIIYYL